MNPDGPMPAIPPTPPQPPQNMPEPVPQMLQAPVAPAAPQYAQPGPVQPTNGMATAALVLGILGFLMVLPLLGSLLGIIFGIVALGQIKQGKGSGRGIAQTGLWLGVASLVLTILIVVGIFIALPALQRNSRDATRQAEVESTRTILERYNFDYGQYPAELNEMRGYDGMPSFGADSAAKFTYSAKPNGCVNTAAATAASPNAPKCTGYSITVKYENGLEDTRTDLDALN